MEEELQKLFGSKPRQLIQFHVTLRSLHTLMSKMAYDQTANAPLVYGEEVLGEIETDLYNTLSHYAIETLKVNDPTKPIKRRKHDLR